MLQERSSPVTCPVFRSQVTPSHKQQSVPSFHDSVLGCWQSTEAELLMEKDSLNWSKERFWSSAQKWEEEIVEWKWKRNRKKERDEIGENPMFGWPYRIQSIFGRDEEWRKTLFIDKVILDCIQTDIGCVKHVKTKSNLKKQQVSEWVLETRQSILNKIPCWLQIVQTELLFLGKVIITLSNV
jgi:hypothetical protein